MMKKIDYVRAARISSYAVLAGLWLAAPATIAQSSFDRVLKLNGVSFQVTSSNESSLNDVTITPTGLETDNAPITIKEADGAVVGADIADLNDDGSPEIYVYVSSAGSGSYGSLIAYSTNNNKSISEIYLPPLEDNKDNAKGYAGHDSFSVEADRLVRRFPVYKESDSNAQPTGGTRQIEYSLVQGEAGWLLKPEKSSQN